MFHQIPIVERPLVSEVTLSAFRVISATSAPEFRAIVAAAKPTLVVPPQISSFSLFFYFKDLKSESYAVYSISGMALRTS